MEELKALLVYQEAENDLEELERSLKNTDTRKRLVRQQEVFKANQTHLRHIEQESMLTQNALVEITAQVEYLRAEMEEKAIEIREIDESDLEDLFLEDVQEMVKECEAIRSSLETNKRKLVDIMRQLESSQQDAQKTLMRMSRAKKSFDELKEQHSRELEAGRGDLERRKHVVSAAARKVPEDLLRQYREIKQHRSNPVVYLKERRCQGCNMEVPSGVLQELRNGDHVVVCENCGRILMTAEGE